MGREGRRTLGIGRDAQNKPILQKSQPPEILFIERAIQLLKPGSGRMAMVIPMEFSTILLWLMYANGC